MFHCSAQNYICQFPQSMFLSSTLELLYFNSHDIALSTCHVFQPRKANDLIRGEPNKKNAALNLVHGWDQWDNRLSMCLFLMLVKSWCFTERRDCVRLISVPSVSHTDPQSLIVEVVAEVSVEVSVMVTVVDGSAVIPKQIQNVMKNYNT